jgi:hypothetical protein
MRKLAYLSPRARLEYADSAPIERQAGAFRLGLRKRGVSRERAEEGGRNFAQAQAALNRVVSAGEGVVERRTTVPMKDLVHYSNLARRIYAISHRLREDEWQFASAQAAVRWIGTGLDAGVVLDVLEACWRVLPHRLSDCRSAGVRELAEKLSREGVTMEEVKMPNYQLPMTNDGTQAAEPKRRRAATGSDRVMAGTVKPTPLEQYTEKRAVEQLRLALARFEPVVKKCVAFRLLRHESYKKLARELDLSLDEVNEILAAVRPKVRAFTTYFDTDWHWVEGTKRTFVS